MHPPEITTADIFINDVTLRDGEQAPGNTMSEFDKMIIAVQLNRLGINGMEAGFPAASEGDFYAVKSIAETVGHLHVPSTNIHPRISGLARLWEGDIRTALSAVEPAPNRGIHTFIATSKAHLPKFADSIQRAGGNSESMGDFIGKIVIPGIEQNFGIIKEINPDAKIQFSMEDWTRTEEGVSDDVVLAAAYNGVNIINLPDTVGLGIPRVIHKRVAHVRSLLDNAGFHDVIISWHGHNDTGQGIACAMEAFYAGARQFEPTILGIGERTGNYSFEALLAAIDANRTTHENIIEEQIRDTIVRLEVMKTALLVSRTIGIEIPREHPLVGENAFAEESGIHVDGISKGGTDAYHAVTAGTYGAERKVIIGKHSGWANMVDFCTRHHLPFQHKDRDIFMGKLKSAAEDRRKGLSDDEVLQEVYYPTVIMLTNEGVPRIENIRDYTQDATVASLAIRLPAGPEWFEKKHVQVMINVGKNGTRIMSGMTQQHGEELIAAAVEAIKQEIPGVEVVNYHNDMATHEGSHSDAIGTVVLKSNGFSATGKGVAKGVDASNLLAIQNAFNALWAQIEYARMITEERN